MYQTLSPHSDWIKGLAARLSKPYNSTAQLKKVSINQLGVVRRCGSVNSKIVSVLSKGGVRGTPPGYGSANGSFSLFLDKAEFQKSGKLKGFKSSYSLRSCLFEVLKVRHLRDQPLTDKQTDRQTK